jgi:hypothetical protein
MMKGSWMLASQNRWSVLLATTDTEIPFPSILAHSPVSVAMQTLVGLHLHNLRTAVPGMVQGQTKECGPHIHQGSAGVALQLAIQVPAAC